MFRRPATKLIILLLLLCGKWVTAQRVLYSPFIDDHFEVAGKVGNYYWVEKKVKNQDSKERRRGQY
jgi:hypothetical protein